MPGTFDADAKDRYVVATAAGNSPATAAELVGFTPATVRKHLNEDQDFAERVRDARLAVVGRVEDNLVKGALQGLDYERDSDGEIISDKDGIPLIRDRDLNFIKFFLQHNAPEKYADRRTVEHVGPGGGPIQIGHAVAVAVKGALTDPETREQMLANIDAIPATALPAPED